MIDLLLLLLIVITALAAVRTSDLLSATMILGAYSLIMALVWTTLNAVDVAFTEASVGAGITTVLMLAALSRTKRREDESAVTAPKVKGTFKVKNLLLFFVVFLTFGALVYGTMDMPEYGDPNAPAHTHVAPRYIHKSVEETGFENFVTAILASYRGYDTLGETSVIFTAAMGVILLLRRKKKIF